MMARLARLLDHFKYGFVPWIAGGFHRQINRSNMHNVESVDLRHAKHQLSAVVSKLDDIHAAALRYGSTGNER